MAEKVSDKRSQDCQEWSEFPRTRVKTKHLAVISSDAINRWQSMVDDKDMTADTRNEYVLSMYMFCNWYASEQQIDANLLTMALKSDRISNCRHIIRY
mgnify:CR=1 FL=1|tara:strand:+ start:183 stop:476 length:294 start_codon:yes stop_codon:yes gene_type:complete